MSEPVAQAASLREVVPGVFRCHIQDERVDAPSESYAVAGAGGVVLVDPLPMSPRARASLEKLAGERGIAAICLTASHHQRCAWRYRDQFGARVHAPQGARGLERSADHTFRDGDQLPGGLLALRSPGPSESHYAFLLPKSSVLFCGDLLCNIDRAGTRFIVSDEHKDPAATRESVRKLLDRDFRVICFAHGEPVTRGARRAILAALRRDAASPAGGRRVAR